MRDRFDFAEDYRFGPTQVLDWLFLAGEEDIDEPLYGKLMTPEDITPYSYFCQPKVQYWIDFNNIELNHPFRRKVFFPSNVTFIRMPFADGDKEALERVMPVAKQILDMVKVKNEKALVSCQAGVSRSALLALWCMADEMGYEKAWKLLKELRPHVEFHPNFADFIEKNIVPLRGVSGE